MGYAGDDHVRLAATVEFIHTATLLHDDVVDESLQRRGRATANLLWDNKSSVLVGDYLFARAFQLMVETGSLRVLDILSNAAATIAEGEVLQLTAARNLATTEEVYLKVVRGKTAALFSAATEVGGVIAGATDAETRALHGYGDALGIAFQIADDLLDWGEGEAIGKNTGDDLREGKLTLPVIRAIAQADSRRARVLGADDRPRPGRARGLRRGPRHSAAARHAGQHQGHRARLVGAGKGGAGRSAVASDPGLVSGPGRLRRRAPLLRRPAAGSPLHTQLTCVAPRFVAGCGGGAQDFWRAGRQFHGGH